MQQYRWRQVACRIWNDEKFIKYPDQTQLAFLFMLTNRKILPIGMLMHTVPGLAAEKHWSLEKMTGALEPLIRDGLVRIDEAHGLIWLPNYLTYNMPSNPNQVLAWRWMLSELPNCDLKGEVVSRLREVMDPVCEENKKFEVAFFRVLETLPKPFRNGLANPVIEKSEERGVRSEERGVRRESERGVSSKLDSPSLENGVFDLWNDKAKAHGFPECKAQNAERRRTLKKRMTSEFWRSNYRAALEKIPDCPFLMGDNKRGWKITIDFFLRPKSVARIMEGEFDGKAGGKTGARTNLKSFRKRS
jgi:hypothetical protein